MILLSAEIGPFLESLFSGAARKPKRLKLKPTASVARYLKAVAWEAQPSQEREELERLVDVIWLAMLQYDRQYEIVHDLQRQSRDQLSELVKIRTDLEHGVAFNGSASQPSPTARHASAIRCRGELL